jgi:cell division protein FtsB
MIAEAKAERGDQLLRQFVDGRQDPGELARRVAELEAENRDLRARLAKGREGVDQMLASIRFLEDRR